MADGIYIAMAGATARMAQLDSVSDNLANAQSLGFKAQRPAFEAFLPTQDGGTRALPEAPVAVATQLDLSEGPREATGQPLDVVPEGGSFLSVSLPGGGVGYTRNGQISVGANELLVTAGHPLLDADGRVIQVPTGEKVDLSPRGLVSVKGAPLAQLATYQLTGPLDRVGPSVIALGRGGVAAPAPASGQLRVGELERGNYSSLEGMIQMIDAQRSYESAMQAIQTYRTMGSKSNQMGIVQQQ